MEQPHKSAEQIETAKKNSRLGIASFAIAMTVWGLAIILIVVSAAFQGNAYPSGYEFPLYFIGSVVGLALGIAGVRQRGPGIAYAIVGIIFNSIVVIGFGIVFLAIYITGY